MTCRLRFWLLAVAAAILFLGAIRLGDLAGYDDAMYAGEAKNIAADDNWITPHLRGIPAFEHPPLFVWTQAVFILTLGKSDWVAKLPSALCAIGAILLVYWLARRLLNDTLAASVAMFVMLATPYFIKYAGRAMTDVPTAFLFISAICACTLASDNPRWHLAVGALTAMALMVRGLIGFGLLAIFAMNLIALRRRPPWRYVIAALVIAIAPLAAWYAQSLVRFSGSFVNIHEGWLNRAVFGPLNPPWRRYTGLFEYMWMLTKSYWPWLPFTIAGIVIIIRARRRELFILLGWVGIMLLLCGAASSRVLRYMLPAYPALSILAAVGLLKWIPRRIAECAMNWLPPLAPVAAVLIVLLVRPSFHAVDTRAIAEAQSRVLPPGTMVGLYDKGDPRNDEANELEWYGNDVPEEPYKPKDLDAALRRGAVRIFVVDRDTYARRLASIPHEVIAQAGHLVSVRLK
jgi:4-amino-4-deoxy-L-arabinose transferase-like glycosyltransferase